VTLSTFRDVPWNGRFYRRHGFADLAPADWTPGMHLIHEQEANHGLRTEARVFMRRDMPGDINRLRATPSPPRATGPFVVAAPRAWPPSADPSPIPAGATPALTWYRSRDGRQVPAA
jgi:hypothetical protein